MGNSTSSRRSSGARELEKYTQPTGLYPSCPWEPKAARRMILDRKIAPRFPGRESKESCFTQECPICFMFYPGNLNVSTCCKKPICSECFLQMKPPKKMISCPFCNRETFGIKYTAPAVIELSSIYSERNASSPELAPPTGAGDRSLAQHYASVADRQKLRDDLRSQLNIADGPITTPPVTSSVALQDALLYASPADASQLEELMLLEAIRRSMYDLALAKSAADAAAAAGTAGGGDGALPVAPAHVTLHERRRSTNPFDDDDGDDDDDDDDAFDASSCGERDELGPRRTGDWNPFAADD